VWSDCSAKSWDLLSLLLGRQEVKTQWTKCPTSTPKHPKVSRRVSSRLQTTLSLFRAAGREQHPCPEELNDEVLPPVSGSVDEASAR